MVSSCVWDLPQVWLVAASPLSFEGNQVCFWPELTTRLNRLVARAVIEEVGTILLADPGQSTFFRLADHCTRRFGARLIDLKTTRRRGADGHLLIIDASR